MRLENEKSKNTFIYALSGWKKAIKSEKNLKVDSIIAVIVIILGFLLKISISEWIICLLLIGCVLSAELMNTAIETVVDMYTREKNVLAEKAKDISAGAVLIIAVVAAIIGLIIFIPKIVMLNSILNL